MKRKTKTTTKTTAETRVECSDWSVAISDRGFARRLNRKVLTKGTTQIAIPDAIYARLCAELKAGNEVCFAANGEAFVRFYPMMYADLSSMYAAAMTLNSLRNSTYSGMKDFRLVTRSGKTKRDKADVDKMMKRKESEIALLKKSLKQIRHGVTPDIMINCPNCGYEIRVGKKLAA
jgi:hypothetical protein